MPLNYSKHKPIYFVLVWMILLFPALTLAQTGPDKDKNKQDTASDADDATTIFPHSNTSRFWISGQINIIFQAHSPFHSPYIGPNSLRPFGEHATSRVLTLYTGYEITKNTEVFFDLESAGGRGISDALGLAGFTNLDVVRNPTLGSKPYIARLMIRQIIPLSSETVETERTPFALATTLPARRLEIRFGKFSTADFFDVNTIGSDSHLQFMNWTVDNNGAYDYAADTRGYTYGAIIEYQSPKWGIRFGEMLMPKVANGIRLDLTLRKSRAENIETEFRRNFLPGKQGTLRLLSYINHANMGSYREAINAFLAGIDPVPDITAHRRPGTVKYGFGLNFEQPLNDIVRVFGRTGWNEGHKESFAYTEVDNTLELGADFKATLLKRKEDKIGAAFTTNGISRDHQEYLALGGLGFLLGDGRLNYGREQIFEGYYNFHLWRGVFTAFDLQAIAHPSYNRDRGPVIVPGIRFHVDF